MKQLLIIPLLAGCNVMGGIQPDTIDAIASAGGGCVAVKSLVMGEGVMMIGNAAVGASDVTIAAACGGITIRNANVPAVKP